MGGYNGQAWRADGAHGGDPASCRWMCLFQSEFLFDVLVLERKGWFGNSGLFMLGSNLKAPIKCPVAMMSLLVRDQKLVRKRATNRASSFKTMWMDGGTTIEDVKRRVRAALVRNTDEFEVLEANPQLSDDVLTVCVFPTWWRSTGRVPIFFAHHDVDGLPFMGVVPAECSLGDLYDTFGSVPPSYMRLYQQNESDPFPRDGKRIVSAGTLFILREVRQQRVELPDITEALEDLYWARDLDANGVPEPLPADSKYLAIAPDSATVIETSEELTVVQLHSFACEVLNLGLHATTIIMCRQPMVNMSFAGKPFSRAIALVPTDWLQEAPRRTGVFIDARDLGESITFHVCASNTVTLDEVISLLDFAVPEHMIVRISGTDGPYDDAGRHRISPGSLLTLWAVDRDEAECAEEELLPTSSEEEEDDVGRAHSCRPVLCRFLH